MEPKAIQGEWHSFGISFFPVREGSCLVLKTKSLNHGENQFPGVSRGSKHGDANDKCISTVGIPVVVPSGKFYFHLIVKHSISDDNCNSPSQVKAALI